MIIKTYCSQPGRPNCTGVGTPIKCVKNNVASIRCVYSQLGGRLFEGKIKGQGVYLREEFNLNEALEGEFIWNKFKAERILLVKEDSIIL